MSETTRIEVRRPKDDERRGQARVLATVLSHRPSEVTRSELASEVGTSYAESGGEERLERAVAGLVDVGLLCTLDDSVLATPAAVRFKRLEELAAA